MKHWKFILLFAALYAYCGRDGARAQQTQPVSTPQANCILLYPATGTTGTSQVLDNRAVGCVNFAVSLSVPSTVSVISWTVQSAQDNGSPSCSTCSWSTVTAATGANPIISIAGGNATFTTAAGTAYYDFLRMTFTATGTGLLYGKLTGTLSSSGGGGGGGGGGCVGTSASPCIVAGPDATGATPTQNPVFIAGLGSGNEVEPVAIDRTNSNSLITEGAAAIGTSSSTMIHPFVGGYVDASSLIQNVFACSFHVPVTIAGSGTTLLVSGTAPGGFTRMCSLSLLLSGPSNIQLIEGSTTATPCDTSPANMTGVFPALLSWDPPWSNMSAMTTVAFNDDICIVVTSSVTGGGDILYAQF